MTSEFHPAPRPVPAASSGSLAFAGLQCQAELLASGAVSSAELVEAALDAVEATQPTINAFCRVRTDAARVEAAEADRRLAAGSHGPLLGVPIAIKDDMDIHGEPTAFGCAGDFPPKSADSEVVRRLRKAGAIIVGKTNTPEFGQWPFTESKSFGVTRNPWDLTRSPGGSSGGSAAAVAAGVVAAALGSDGAGSVRIPAAWTHLVGIKPQRGRISGWPDADAFNGLTCNGPLARTVADAAYLLDVVTGNHPGDRYQLPLPARPWRAAANRDPGRLRIGVSLRAPFSLARVHLDAEVGAAVERLAEVLAAQGHDVVTAEPAYRLMGLSFLGRSMPALTEWGQRVPDLEALDHRTQANCRFGRRVAHLLPMALAAEGRIQRRVGAVFEQVDVLLAPTTASLPLPIGYSNRRSGWSTDQAMAAACPYAWPWNVLGWPAVSVPGGLSAAGWPIGAQLLGPAGSEARLISLAAQLEATERWFERVPPHAITPPR